MSRIATVMAWAEDRGKTRGLQGASSVWLAIWVLSTGYRFIKKMTKQEPIVVRETLQPGQQLIVTHFEKGAAPPASQKASRRSRRSKSA